MEWRDAQDHTVQELHGLTSTSEWTGVKLATLLEAAGLKPEAAWVLAEGGDAAGLNRSVPLTGEVLSDAMVCYGQNGEALRPEQGYPVRLLLPGFEGNINIKWLRRLKVGSTPFMTRWETSKYTDLMPNGTAYQFSLVMEAKSVITSPSGQPADPSRLSRDSWFSLERKGTGREGRGDGGRGANLAYRGTAGTRAVQVPHEISCPLDLEWRGDGAPKPVRGPNRIPAAVPRCADQGPWYPIELPL